MSAAFQQLVETELTAVRRFIDLLKQEQDALRNSQLDDLERLTSEKTAQLNTLTALGEGRSAWLRETGLMENPDSVERWLRQQANPALLQVWHDLQTLARQARILNDLNGQSIRLLAHNNQQLLDTLTGQQNRERLYGPDGQTSATPGSRISDAV